MAKLQEMLTLNGGSFAEAEKMAWHFIHTKGKNYLLDLVLLLHAQGKIDEARKRLAEYQALYPDCALARHGATWFDLYDGNLEQGLKHIDAGRRAGTLWQDSSFEHLNAPKWDGRKAKPGDVLLLYGEGGQGDEIMGVRCAEWLARDYGFRVIVACGPNLVRIFSRSPGVGATINRDRLLKGDASVHYDCWIPMMDAYALCGRTWETLYTSRYIQADDTEAWRRMIPDTGRLRVGIRWRGLPTWEHEQLRLFPPKHMHDLVRSHPDVDWYSLQKDDLRTPLPDNLMDLAPFLSSWEQTASAVKRLDLVISSCTSVPHLSAAMGKPTWIVVPVMCYWPWARPGPTSHWYPSVRLFRQKCYGDWTPAFNEMYKAFDALLDDTRSCGSNGTEVAHEKAA